MMHYVLIINSLMQWLFGLALVVLMICWIFEAKLSWD
jgi:hypothetical protein